MHHFPASRPLSSRHCGITPYSPPAGKNICRESCQFVKFVSSAFQRFVSAEIARDRSQARSRQLETAQAAASPQRELSRPISTCLDLSRPKHKIPTQTFQRFSILVPLGSDSLGRHRRPPRITSDSLGPAAYKSAAIRAYPRRNVPQPIAATHKNPQKTT